MSVEDDVARVSAVTAELSSPQKVWILHVDPENGTEQISAHKTKEGALGTARADMLAAYTKSVGDVDNLIATLSANSSVAVDGCDWYVLHHSLVNP